MSVDEGNRRSSSAGNAGLRLTLDPAPFLSQDDRSPSLQVLNDFDWVFCRISVVVSVLAVLGENVISTGTLRDRVFGSVIGTSKPHTVFANIISKQDPKFC